MEIAAFASFAALVIGWIVLPVRTEAPPVVAVSAPATLAEPVAA